MRVMLYNNLSSSSEAKWKKEGSYAGDEPISVLDTRSPSPSTSTSTLSSSFGGGGGGGAGGGGPGSTDDKPSVAAVLVAVTESSAGGGGCRKDEWVTELQQISGGLEMSGGERFVGFGLEDWESLVSEPGHDQSLLRWISGDVEDPSFSLKQLLQGATYSNDIVENASPAGMLDQSSISTGNGGGSGLSSNNGKFGSSSPNPNSSSGMVNYRGPNLGLNMNVMNTTSTTTAATATVNNSNSQNSILASSFDNLAFQSLPDVIYQQQQFGFENPDTKSQILNPNVFMNPNLQIQNPFPPLLNHHHHHHHLLQPQPKRQNLGVSDSDPRTQIPKVPFLDPENEFLLKNQQTQMKFLHNHHLQQKPLMVPKQGASFENHYQQQKQAVYDQLYKAAELILAGNFSHAQEILARLNHQLSHSSPGKKPFQRAALYFMEALQFSLIMPQRSPTSSDFVFKIGAYKAFSEISPVIQFMNFTSNQAILEAVDDANHIHVIDFDIGFGAQWASFMQELCGKNRDGGNNPSLKVTAFASPSTHHPLELALMHGNLTQFANDLGVSFELEVVNFDSFDPNSYSTPISQSSSNEAIAVNLPMWSFSNHLSALPATLRFVKQLSPRIIVSFERGGCDGADVPFSHHILHSLQYYEILLDSIDSANVNSDIASKIERFLFLPRIENIVLGRLNAPEKMPNWKSIFATAGLSPMGFSNFSETQAECVVKRIPCRGFHVEKRQMSLMLCWQRRELVTASAWRC